MLISSHSPDAVGVLHALAFLRAATDEFPAADDSASLIPAPDVQGWLVGAVLVTLVFTPVAALLVLTWFRRSVAARMAVGGRAQSAASAGPPSPSRDPLGAPMGIGGPSEPTWGGGALAAVVATRRRRTVAWYSAAAAAYGLVAGVGLLAARPPLDPLAVAVLLLVYAWPLIPTTAVVLGLGVSRSLPMVFGYLVLLVVIASLGQEGLLGGAAAVLVWLVFAAPASLLMAAVAHPQFRAAGPHLALVVLLTSAGLFVWPWVALALVSAGATDRTSLWLGVVVPVIMVPAALVNLYLAVRRFGRKQASEQSLVIDQWWLIFTLFQCLLQWESPASWIGFLAAYGFYRGVTAVGRRRQHQAASECFGPRLLLLRVFGDRSRSELLLRDLSASWRYVGSVALIAGKDLATATLEPRTFFDFLLGRLSRHFVVDRQDLAVRLSQFDTLPDRDGRYRVNDFFCDQATWRDTVRALVDLTDVVVIDLRGLRHNNTGVAFELEHLVHHRLLHRVVALVDTTTDLGFLHHVLESTSRGASSWLRRVAAEETVNTSVLLTQLGATDEISGRPR
jgi:hypothetical protein